MRLTKKSGYGLIALLELAKIPLLTPLSAGAIAEKYALPSPFLEKILHQLKEAGLVTTQKGRCGGYTLAVDPETVSIRRVLQALDESLDIVDCLGPAPECQLAEICPVRTALEQLNQRIQALFDSLSLRDLLEG